MKTILFLPFLKTDAEKTVMTNQKKYAITRVTVVMVLVVLIAIASSSSFVYFYYTQPSCGTASVNGKTSGVAVLADYLSVPTGSDYSTGSRTWQITIANLGNVEVKTVCATILIGSARMTQTILGVSIDGGLASADTMVTVVQLGTSYPVNFTINYANGDTQMIMASVSAIAPLGSPNTTQVTILNDSLYIPSGNLTGTPSATWAFVIMNSGTVAISSLNATFGRYDPPIASIPLKNIVSGDVKSFQGQINLHYASIQAGRTYSVNFVIDYVNGQTENISTALVGDMV